MRKTLFPFDRHTNVAERKSIGGARPKIQAAAEAIAHVAPMMLAARIYAPGAMQHYDDSDPRFTGKSDNVENIYLPAPIVPQAPRSGIAQMFNWLTTGVLK